MKTHFEVDVIASGSSGNSTIVVADDTALLIDAGISAKRITQGLDACGLDPNALSGVLLTHEHADHINGLRVFSKKYDVPIFATEKTWGAIPCRFEIEQKNRKVLTKNLKLGNLKVDFFKISHDAVDPVGYNIYSKESKLSYLTDCGCILPEVVKTIDGAETIVLEANHDEEMLRNGSYSLYLQNRILSRMGHLSNSMAGEILKELETMPKEVFLAHLSQENNDPSLAFQTIRDILPNGEKLKIYVTKQDALVSNK